MQIVVALLALLLKLGLAAVLITDRNDKVKLWCAVCLLFACLFEVSAYVSGIRPYSAYLAFVDQVVVYLRETGMAYAVAMAGLACLNLRHAGVKRLIGLLLLLPPIITAATLRDGILRPDHPFLLAWVSSYLVAAIFLILGKTAFSFSRKQPQLRIKAAGRFVLICVILALLLFHYWSGLLGGRSAFILLLTVLALSALLIMTFRTAALRIKLQLERRIAVDTLRFVSSGTSLLGRSLQNPLTAIEQAANRIAGYADEADSDARLIHQQIGCVYELMRRAERLLEPIEPNEQPYSLNELIHSVIHTCADYHSDKKAPIRFRPNAHAVIRCDRTHLSDALSAVLRNALDALPAQGGAIDIGLARAGSQLLLEFADNGAGIPPEHMPKLTEPFFSTKSEMSGGAFPHLGLGLTYCSLVVGKHDGQLEFESKPGLGTTVRIRLPMKRITALADRV